MVLKKGGWKKGENFCLQNYGLQILEEKLISDFRIKKVKDQKKIEIRMMAAKKSASSSFLADILADCQNLKRVFIS